MSRIDLRRIDLNLLPIFEVLMEERHVSRAAGRLGRTQSAVSHALERLREQLGDPLLVRVGGAMAPTPFALDLFEDVRPILRTIQRALSPREAFAPATSDRTFQVVIPDFWAPSIAVFLERAGTEAPNVAIACAGPRETSLLDLAEQQVDLVVAPSALKSPEGLKSQSVGGLSWSCFMRSGHPAAGSWGREAWQSHRHIVVTVGDRLPSPIQSATDPARLTRRVGAYVPTFAAVPPLLARTDLIATLPHLVLGDGVQHYGLIAREPPFRIEAIAHSVFWSARRSNDPAIQWLLSRILPLLATGNEGR